MEGGLLNWGIEQTTLTMVYSFNRADNAYITGSNEFLADPNASLKQGFILR
jgi:hypothetical protein